MIRGGLVTLFVSDVGRAVRFYVETMGMKLVEQAYEGCAVIDSGEGFRIGLLQQAGSSMEAHGLRAPSIGLYPKIPLREAMAILENRGISFDVKEDGPVVLAHFKDPDQNRLYLCQER